MADILISKFTTQIPRVGATPATPGFAESEGQDPVNPSGTPIQYGIGAGLSLDSLNQIQLGKEPYTEGRVVDLSEWGTIANGSEFIITNSISSFASEQIFNVWNIPTQNGFLFNAYKGPFASSIFLASNKDGANEAARSDFSVYGSLGNIGLYLRTGNYEIGLGTNYAIFEDSVNNKGLEYFSDYESNFTARSLVTKQYVDGAISGAGHNPVTIGSPANGLSISGTQVLTIGLASTSATGALSSTDWNTFNNKLNLTSPITGYTVGANTALADTDTILQAFGKVQGQINARISGTIASGQVAFGTGVNTVGGSSNFTYTNAQFLTIGGTTSNNGINLNGSSSFIRQIIYQVDSVTRWIQNVNQNNFSISRYNASGAFIDNALSVRLSTGFVGIGEVTNPTNTLDVNGTARIRTISNLGSAATSVLVPSATGVVSLRTLAELSADMSSVLFTAQTLTASQKNQARVNIGSTSATPQVITTAGAINDLATTSNHLVFTGASVVLSGIVAGLDGEEFTILNASGTNLELLSESALSTAGNRFASGVIVPNLSTVRIKYRTTTARWVLENVGVNDGRYVRKDVADTKTGTLTIVGGGLALNTTGSGAIDAVSPENLGNAGHRFGEISLIGFSVGRHIAGPNLGRATPIFHRSAVSIGDFYWQSAFGVTTLSIAAVSGNLQTIGTVTHARSTNNTQSVRRDELYLNYSQTVATAGTINDLAINADCKLLILTGADDLTGVVAVDNTRLLRIEARGGNRIIRNESASSTAANRFSIGADLTINAGEVYQFIYTDSRWRRVL